MVGLRFKVKGVKPQNVGTCDSTLSTVQQVLEIALYQLCNLVSVIFAKTSLGLHPHYSF